MDKFWNWLRKKHFIDSIILEGAKIRKGGYLPEKLIISLMIEYCLECKITLDYHLNNNIDINDLFVYLQDCINNHVVEKAYCLQN